MGEELAVEIALLAVEIDKFGRAHYWDQATSSGKAPKCP
jgi:hypothetical protein